MYILSPVGNDIAVITSVCRGVATCACGATAATRVIKPCDCAVPSPVGNDVYPYTGAFCDQCFNFVGGIEVLPEGWEFGNGLTEVARGQGGIFCRDCILSIINDTLETMARFAAANPEAVLAE